MSSKRKKTQEERTNKKRKGNNTIDSFLIITRLPNSEKVKKIWDGLNIEEQYLLTDEFKQMHDDWLYLLRNELRSEYYLNIKRKLSIIIDKGKEILPPRDVMFRCFNHSPENISAIIVGQDLYPNDADGLAFSSRLVRPSLKKIFDLLEWDMKDEGWVRPKTGSLEKWSKSILLLNSILTVEKGKPGSHKELGWQRFTDNVLKLVGNKPEIVTILWGKYAKEKANIVRRGHVIKSGHPSPLNRERSFDNSRCFSLANEYLRKINKPKIDWSL